MIEFLLKGLLRDKSRSLLPIIVVALGVMISVFMHAYLNGVFGESIEKTADFNSGHLQITTAEYAKNMAQMPNDMALMDVNSLKNNLQKQYPDIKWVERIEFGGILDVPDSTGKTRIQGSVFGKGIGLFNSSDEKDRLELAKLLVKGKIPTKAGEILISDELFQKMGLHIGGKVTLISNTMYNEMAMYNFVVAGTLHFGVNMLDKGMMIADVSDMQTALNMENGASEVLGYFNNNIYNDKKAKQITQEFNAKNNSKDDLFALSMSPLSKNGLMGISYDFILNLANFIIVIFIFAMSIVLWNAGLISGLRRYGEFGLRLAIGENKHEVYKSLIWEALLVGIIGTIIGTSAGLLISYAIQKHGIDLSGIMKNSNMMVSNVLRCKITPTTFYVGFFPGILSTVVGAMLAGIGVYKRQTANLFKELEN